MPRIRAGRGPLGRLRRADGGGELTSAVERGLADVRRDGDVLVVVLSGEWSLAKGIPDAAGVTGSLGAPARPTTLRYDAEGLEGWDSTLLAFLTRVARAAQELGVDEDRAGLPDGVRGMLRLAEAVPRKEGSERGRDEPTFVTQVGLTTIEATRGVRAMLAFLGEFTLAFGRWIVGRASYRRADLWLAIQRAGVEAAPIVALVSFLMGVILAFVGAIQLQQFGAAIYVADLVGIAMVRDIGALITGIVMAGRSGAAYAAEIGSMQVNEEIDALTTSGLSPVEFLVLPRVVALVLMMPLLVVYADAVSILGGLLVGITMLDQSFTAYVVQTNAAVTLTHLFPGLLKGTVYGAIVALSGCLRGLQSGRSSLAVGAAATSAVVTSIVLIIAAAGVFALLSYILGI